MKHLTLSVVALLSLTACGSSQPTAPVAPEAPAAAPEAPAAAPAAPAPAGPVLGALADTDPIMGCGCAVVDAGGEHILLGYLMGETEAWANLDGKDRKLTRQGEEQAGEGLDRGDDTFVGDGYTVTVSWSNPQACQPAEECESTNYTTSVKVRSEAGAESTSAGTGSCGC